MTTDNAKLSFQAGTTTQTGRAECRCSCNPGCGCICHEQQVAHIADLERERDEAKRLFESANKQWTLAEHRAEAAEASLAQAQKERDEARDLAADSQMLAHQWMRRHDMIVAGVDPATINFPKPADLPEAIAQARREGMLEAAKLIQGLDGADLADMVAAIRRASHPVTLEDLKKPENTRIYSPESPEEK